MIWLIELSKLITWWNNKAWLIEPHEFELRTGLKKFKAKIKEKQSKMLTAENMGLIKNIIVEVPTRPIKQVCHEKNLKDGLKLGADAKCNPKHARFTVA